ncbi:MAG: tRNA glutamyl-Q(34) synthetase GluQRS [Polyangiaceae bacterium]|nr:tRNA glutamyl-Q(34) synthetase GluQRS [Polyangiaceae bacterium]
MSLPVGRLAPSPTGELHLGHARSFLIAWWYTLSRGGKVVLRIDDLDATRLRPGMTDRVLQDLEWLGLTWEGPIEWQSANRERYLEAASKLTETGLAFPCVCSRSEIERVQSAPHAEDSELHYPGTCRRRFGSWEAAKREKGAAAVRFLVQEGPVEVTDCFSGQHAFDVSSEVGDFVILRKDGAASYQLATVVDDAAAGVTEVVRGDDLLPSAARQQLLQSALKLNTPKWVHLPLVVDENGQRLAKRHGALSLSALRERGTDARSVVQWVASSCGLLPEGPVTPGEILREFQLEEVPHEVVRVGEWGATVL